MTRTLLLVAGAMLVRGGCSDDSQADPDRGPGLDGAAEASLPGAADFTTPVPDSGPTCGPGIYPCGPYGTQVGEVIQNLEFYGYMDPDELCEKNSLKKHDYTQLRKISLKDYYLGSSKAGCGAYKKSMLWVMVSSGWCGPCKAEVSETQQYYKADQIDTIAGLINVLNDSAKPGVPPDADFLKKWSADYSLTMPVNMDPSFKTGVYFYRRAVPFNMLIDLKTMRIYYQQVGGMLENIGKQISIYKSQ